VDPELARLLDRVRALEGTVIGWQQREERDKAARRTRTWQIALAVVTGLVLPVAVVGVLALLNLR
jgi:hypothetical protein